MNRQGLVSHICYLGDGKMKVAILSVVIFTILCFWGADSGFCQESSPYFDGYPCGPPTMSLQTRKRFVKQTAFGFDFRPACQVHDDCYATPGANRKCCDDQQLERYLIDCEYSGDPVRCKQMAIKRYRIIRLFGNRSFNIRQGTVKLHRPITH